MAQAKKRNFTSTFDWEYKKGVHGKVFKDKVSKTVPDESYTIKEILQRFSGTVNVYQPEKVYLEGADFDSPDVEKITQMDPATRWETLQRLRDENAAAREEIEKKVASSRAELEARNKAAAEYEAKLRALVKEREEQGKPNE